MLRFEKKHMIPHQQQVTMQQTTKQNTPRLGKKRQKKKEAILDETLDISRNVLSMYEKTHPWWASMREIVCRRFNETVGLIIEFLVEQDVLP